MVFSDAVRDPCPLTVASTGKQKADSSLRRIIREANDPAPVGMTSGDAVNAALKALLHPKASSVVPTPFGFAQGRLFEKREG